MAVLPTKAKAQPQLLPPSEWDFRFIPPEELRAAVVYEYARSCERVRSVWEPWLSETIGTFAPDGFVTLDAPSRTIREAIRAQLATIPVWARTTDEARALAARIPEQLTAALLDKLVFCTPSFPVHWLGLPPVERAAACSLTPGGLLPFRDAVPPWTAKWSYRVAVDLDADPTAIRREFDWWLTRKQQEHRRQVGAKPAQPATTSLYNPGRAAVPRREALSWLGSYRFRSAGITYPVAEIQVTNWLARPPFPPHSMYAKPWTKGMNSGLWSRWCGNAIQLMDDMFKPRLFPPAPDLVPDLRRNPDIETFVLRTKRSRQKPARRKP